jgi:hypothetical protein
VQCCSQQPQCGRCPSLPGMGRPSGFVVVAILAATANICAVSGASVTLYGALNPAPS